MQFENKTIKKRNDGRWWTRYYQRGVQKCVYGKTQEECLKNLKKALRKKKQEEKNASTFTVHQWLDFWYNTYKKPGIVTKTPEINIRLHLKPNLPDINIENLNSQTIQQMLNKLPTSNLKAECFKLLSASLKVAVQNELLKKNPMEMLKKPSHIKIKGVALTKSEEKAFLQKIAESEHEDIFKFLLFTGVRRGEALGLRQRDIDFDAGQIKINGTKTESSKRVIPLFAQLRKILQSYCTEDSSQKKLWTFDKDTLTHVFKDICPEHKLHDLRHTFATRCIENGVSMKTVQRWLGHSSYEVTANTYVGILNDFERQEIKRVDSLFDTHFDT